MDAKKYKNEVKAWKERWERVNEFEREELRCLPPETRLRQFFAMVDWVKAFGWKHGLEEGLDVVRQRWTKLKKGHHG
jgi:hypothetical protein